MNKIKDVFLSLILIIVFSSYSFTSYKLTSKRLEKCKRIREILVKNFDELPQDKGWLESIILSSHLTQKLNGIKDSIDRKELVDFITSDEIRSVYVRDKYCVRFEFRRRNPFLFWWQSYYLIYHTPNNTKHGCPDNSVKKCRLFPWECAGCEKIVKTDSIDVHWAFVATKGHASGYH